MLGADEAEDVDDLRLLLASLYIERLADELVEASLGGELATLLKETRDTRSEVDGMGTAYCRGPPNPTGLEAYGSVKKRDIPSVLVDISECECIVNGRSSKPESGRDG
jgi:hypothetical protein